MMNVAFSNYEVTNFKVEQNFFQNVNSSIVQLNISFFDIAIIWRCLTSYVESFNKDFFFNYYFSKDDTSPYCFDYLLFENDQYQILNQKSTWGLEFLQQLNWLLKDYFEQNLKSDSNNSREWFPSAWVLNKGCQLRAFVKITGIWGPFATYEEKYYLTLYDKNNVGYEIASINEKSLSETDMVTIKKVFTNS